MINKQRLLLLSNSKMHGEEWLAWPAEEIKKFLGKNVKKVVFIPYAAVTFSYDEYAKMAKAKFNEWGYELISVHNSPENECSLIDESDAVIVGGGNTFALLFNLNKTNLTAKIAEAVQEGKPYIGWSAGSNVVCPTIKTTNDMPIIYPGNNLTALNLIPIQINPHYIDPDPKSVHQGETREQRLQEFIALNSDTWVVGLREGSLLIVENGTIKLKGTKSARIFKHKIEPVEVLPEADLNYIIKKN